MNVKNGRRVVFTAAALLTVCAILLVSASYAWISLSTMPEVSGIRTNVGANGSLEVALLEQDTFIEPESIRTKIGGSVQAQEATVSNLQWGNLLDLSHESYGLSQITLVPAKLNVNARHIVDSSLLMFPDYGADGRFSVFSSESSWGNYQGGEAEESVFSCQPAQAQYGVRGIGSVRGMNPRHLALHAAPIMVTVYHEEARKDLIYLWEDQGSQLVSLLQRIYRDEQPPQTEEALQLLETLAQQLYTSLESVQQGMRYALTGYSALYCDDEAQFILLRNALLYEGVQLSSVMETVPQLPQELHGSIYMLEQAIQQVNTVLKICEQYHVTGTMELSVQKVLEVLINPDKLYINEVLLSRWESDQELTEDNLITAVSDTFDPTPFHAVGQFIKGYSSFCQAEGKSVELTTLSQSQQAPALTLLEQGLLAKEDQNELDYAFPIRDIYGFAVDMAFRCNRDCQLQLQTAQMLRVDGMDVLENQGGGSYMRFESEQMSDQQIVLMMDAIRVGFLDNQNRLLAIAKLNTASYALSEDGVLVPLYLYEYTVGEDGTILTGERRSEDIVITQLRENKPQVITAVVWLDGDHVNNSLAAIRDQSMVGTLNLQFSSSVELNPADFQNKEPQPDEQEVTDPAEVTDPQDSAPNEPEES